MPATPFVAHGSFVIDRRYPAAVERVYAAWVDPALKARWFVGPDGWTELERTLDVREGGIETLRGRHPRTPPLETLFTARYHDVRMCERLVYVYDMHLNGSHHSVSLATVEFRADGAATAMKFTEHVTYLDGTTAAQGVPMREAGTALHLDRISNLFA